MDQFNAKRFEDKYTLRISFSFLSAFLGVLGVSAVAVLFFTPIARAQTPLREVNLLAMGDWGTDGKDQRAVANSIWKYVGRSPIPMSGMLLVGDNFYMKLPGGTKDVMWTRAFEKMYDPARLNFPFFAVLGNHDYLDGKDTIEMDYAKQNPTSRWRLPGRWYRVDFPQDRPLVTALMLDSNREKLGPERWQQQHDWLDAELSKPRGTWTICCAHHPLFSNGGHGDNSVLQNDWGRLFVKYNVDFYICGHDHDLQHLQIANWFTSFVLVGGGGAGLAAMRHDDRGPLSRLTHGFGSLDFTDSAATVKYITEDDKLLHEFKRAKDGTVTVVVEGGDDKAASNPLRALEGFGEFHPPASQPSSK